MSLNCKEEANVKLIILVSMSKHMLYRPVENIYIKLGPRQKQ